MRHRASRKFWEYYRRLPSEIRALADRNYALLKTDPLHPSLHFKRIGKFRSVRIGIHHRALAVEEGDDVIWFWIGRHDEYDRLIAD